MDNKNSDGATVNVTRTYQGDATTREVNTSYYIDNLEAIKNGTSSSNDTSPNLTPHGDQDQPFAIFLGTDLGEGTHDITVVITEDGDPWENVQTYYWTLEIINASPFDQESISE